MIRVELQDVPVCPFEGLINIQHRLNSVGTGGKVRQCTQRRPNCPITHVDRISRFPAIHVDTENLLCLESPCYLKARFALEIPGDHEDEPPINLVVSSFRTETNLECRRRCQRACHNEG